MRSFLCALSFILLLSGCGGSSSSSNDSNDTNTTSLDTEAPIVILNGSATINLNVGDTYTEAGATAVDNIDGAVAPMVSGTVDTNTAGTYTVTYRATDRAGNIGIATRMVIVSMPVAVDTEAPVITLNGENNVTLYKDEAYTEAGATAVDNIDDNVNVTITGSVDTSKIGSYTVEYRAVDTAGNVATLQRTVVVKIYCTKEYSADVLEGRELYNNYCKVCHNSDAKSGVFDIRNSSVAEIDDSFLDVPQMVELNLAEQILAPERALISLYLKTIAVDPDVEFGDQCAAEALSKADLGSQLFFDANLSLRRTMSCSTCHNPGHGFVDARFHREGDTNPVAGALSVGDDGVTLGGRNAPTAAYAHLTPTFGQNATGDYFGGQFHDGRAATLKDQAKGPFLDPAEMMMPTPEAVVDRVLENPQYVTDFKALYGETVFDDNVVAYDAVAESIATFEQTDLFSPFDSKYDRSQLGASDPDYYSMSTLEQQGHQIFFDTNRTNCVFCHAINSETESPNELFTNFQYENIGTPKNIPALMARDGNSDRTDLQLGGRSDINASTQFGRTKVPTLRNIAVTGPYMSNGVFKELRTVLAFYNHRSGQDSTPMNPETNATWGTAEVNATVNHALLAMEPLTEAEMDALEAFLKTLTDQRYETLLEE